MVQGWHANCERQAACRLADRAAAGQPHRPGLVDDPGHEQHDGIHHKGAGDHGDGTGGGGHEEQVGHERHNPQRVRGKRHRLRGVGGSGYGGAGSRGGG